MRQSPSQTIETTQLLSLSGQIQLEAAAGDPASGKPALPRFSMVAYTGGPMQVAGWRYPVIVDLQGMQIPSQSRPIRLGHDASQGVGHTDSIRIESGQLIAKGVVSRNTEAAKEVVTSSGNGFPWQASIGASVQETEFIKENQKVQVNGREFSGPVNVVRRSNLGEISFVDLGADGNTQASVAANQKEPVMEKPETTVLETETKIEVKATQGAPAPVGIPDPAAEMRAQAAAESKRIAMVRTVFAGKFSELEACAISEGWDENRCELEKLRAERPKVPNTFVRSEPETNARVLEAACLVAGRISKPERFCDEQSLDAADRLYHGKITLQDLLMEAAWANGYSGRRFHDCREVLRFAYGNELRAGLSSIDIGPILSNVANKFLLDGFYSVERTWRNICAVRPVTDFKTVTSYRLTGGNSYQKVAPGGELKHGTLGNEKYTNQADTYGLMFSIDRREIINDDLGALTALPRQHGRNSGLTINEIFWATFLNNAAFFSAANKNFLSGADTTLGIDGLSQAEQTFNDQVDGNNKPIGTIPVILLVPTSLSATSAQLFKATEIRDNTAGAKYPITNPHQGKFRTEVSRYLATTSIPGNSSKAWYLLSDPLDLPVIEVAFLNGQESPTIETSEADFNVLGIQMRGYHDFGVALQDPRGGVKSKGEV